MALVFKKKGRRPAGGAAHRRKRPTGSTDDGEGGTSQLESEEEEDDTALKLADLREEQRMRAKGRRRGRETGELLKAAEAEANPLIMRGAGVDGPDGGGRLIEGGGTEVMEIAGAGSRSLTRMIESQFQSGGDALGAPSGIQHERYMEAYVEEKLGLQGSSGVSAGDPGEPKLSEEDKLYIIPEDMRRTVEEAKKIYGTKGLDDEDAAGGAQLAWNTGIAEVELPVEEQRLNEMRTMAALEAKNLLRIGGGERRSVGNTEGASGRSGVVGSIAANYSRHQAKYAHAMKKERSDRRHAEKETPVLGAGDGAAANPRQPTQISNDDIAVGRFIKRMRR